MDPRHKTDLHTAKRKLRKKHPKKYGEKESLANAFVSDQYTKSKHKIATLPPALQHQVVPNLAPDLELAFDTQKPGGLVISWMFYVGFHRVVPSHTKKTQLQGKK